MVPLEDLIEDYLREMPEETRLLEDDEFVDFIAALRHRLSDYKVHK